MIRHVLLMNFKSGISHEQQIEFTKEIVRALGQIPGVRNIIAGTTSYIQGKPAYDAGLFIDFDDQFKLKAYLEHPLHQAAHTRVPTLCSRVTVLDFLY